MIRKKGKILIIVLIFIITFNFCYPTIYADNGAQSGSSNTDLGTAVDFGLGLLINPIIMLAYWFGEGLLLLTNVAGANNDETVTPETILFNKLELTNINFFESTSADSFTSKLQENIASWYYVMRTIAIIGSLCVLLYIAIRMATSTVATDKAEYKRMLMDWAVGFILIFVLHYIIILVINANNLIVNILAETMNDSSSGQLTNFIEQVSDQVKWAQEVSKTLTATFIFVILVGITLAFLLMYIKRLIVVAFLIVIAPLITITYAIDKVGDSKSQALDSWMKEFMWTVLIQPFHCVIYVVFASVVMSSLDASNFSTSVLAIMCLVFILQAEDIVKKIFGIQADNIGKMSSSFAVAAGGALALKKFGGKAGRATAQGTGKAVSAIANKLPQTENGKGIGTGPIGSGVSSLSQKVANAWGSDAVQNKLKSFNNFIEDNKLAKGIVKAGKVYADVGYKAGTTMFGTALATPTAKGVQDLIEGGVAGYVAGNAIKAGAKWVAKKGTTDVIENGRTKNAERNLNESFKQMKADNKFDNEQMLERAKILFNMDLNSEIGKKLEGTEKLLAYNMQVMKHQLEKTGEDGSFESVIRRINLKDTENNNATNSGNNNGSNETRA